MGAGTSEGQGRNELFQRALSILYVQSLPITITLLSYSVKQLNTLAKPEYLLRRLNTKK